MDNAQPTEIPWSQDCLEGRHQIESWEPWEGMEDDDGRRLEIGTCTKCRTTIGRRQE